MKQKNLLKIVFCLIFISNMSFGQLVTTIDFETENSGYTLSTSEGSSQVDVFNRINDNIGGNNTFKFGIEDSNVTPANIQLDQINVSGSNSFTFSIDLLSRHFDKWDAGDELKISYSIDSGSYENLMWVQNTAGGSNAPAALDTDFDGTGECGPNTTLPALTTGTSEGCIVSSSNFATFTRSSISLDANTTLDIRLEFIGLTSTDEGIYIDNIIITETVPSSETSVSFNSATSSVSEDGTSIDVCVGITNPDASTATTVEVALNGGITTATNPGDYTPSSVFTTTLTFPANSSADQCITINLTDDSDSEANEVLVLDLQTPGGGNNADLGGITQHTLSITDDDLPNIIFNEILASPGTSVTPSDSNFGDANGDGLRPNSREDEFVEIVNLEATTINIGGYTISETNGIVHTFTEPTNLTAGGSIVVFGGGTPTGISGLAVTSSTGNLELSNTGETVTLKNSEGTTISSLTYSSLSNQSFARSNDLTGDGTGHNSIVSNPVNFSPGEYNTTGEPYSTNTWTGTTNNDWASASNWSLGTVPGSGDDVQIIQATNQPTTSSVVTINSVKIASGATLVSSNTFTVNSATYTRSLTNGSQWYYMSSPVIGESYDNAWVTNNSIPSSTLDTGNRGISWYDNSSSDTDSDGGSTDDSATGFWRYMEAGTSTSFGVGRGYGIIRSGAGDISFTGTGIYTSDQTFLLEQGLNDFNLLGNPFTAFITLGTFHTKNTANIGTDFYFWNGSSYTTKTSGSDATYEIAPGQGFFVEASSETNVTFEIADASHESSDTFQKSTNTRPEIILNVTEGGNDRFARILYVENTSKGYDAGYDGKLFGGVSYSFSLYSDLIESDGKKYQVQTLPNSDYENMIIPIGITADAGKEITFTAETLNLPSDIKVFLEDRVTNLFTRLDEANSEYKFTLTEKTDGIGRFYLHTKSSVLGTSNIDLESISIYKSNTSTLRIAGLSNGKSTVKLFNILGKQVLKTSFTSNNGVQDINLPKLATGIYVVQLETEAGQLNKKITLE